MTSFLILAGVMIALALAFVLPALTRRHADEEQSSRARANVLIYRDQLTELDNDLKNEAISKAQYDAGRREVERRVLEDTLASLHEAPPAAGGRGKWAAIALSVIIPLAAVGLYLKLGAPQSVSPEMASADAAQPNAQAPHSVSPDKIREMAEKLAERLKQQPNDAEGWNMLARSYRVLGQFKDAADAYQHAIKLVPGDAQLYADYADALGMAQGQVLEGEPMRMVEQSLKLDPNNVKALALAGTAAYDKKDFNAAADYWQKALQHAPPDSEFAQSLQTSLDDAKAHAEGRPLAQNLPNIMPQQSAQTPAPAGPGASLSGKVSVAPALAAKVSPNDTLFIYARAETGPPMPLAILRKKASELPVDFTLDDSSAMTPNFRLSNFPKVMVLARISKNGNAMPQSGDLEGSIGPVAASSSKLSVKIDRVVP
ncbi:MAG TPA: c-type cytochrome biogenesis protein CcmI [Thiobacillaceae bacterium]|nr:c-type cytochrome biogenesis protein CcmI [Thiobacillaceae bacterium]